MTDATTEFFDRLAERGHEQLLEKATGTLKFELVDGKRVDRWLLSIDKGDVTVSRKGTRTADCTVRAQKELFDGIAGGKVNAMAAVLRGELTIVGDAELVVLLQRLFPSPPPARARRRNRAGRRKRA
jgi:putative sterol carrier protein